jgi:hypothetical protein
MIPAGNFVGVDIACNARKKRQKHPLQTTNGNRTATESAGNNKAPERGLSNYLICMVGLEGLEPSTKGL